MHLNRRPPSNPVVGLVYEVRPWQWYKQSMLLLGIVFSGNLFSITAWVDVSLAVVSFCAVAGATYVVNDISDLEADRQHPEKQHRPIASGVVPVPIAVVYAAILFVAGIGLAAMVNPLLLGVVILYVAQNVLYSWVLKELVLVDVLVIAVGFVLRAIGGVVAIDVYLSPWLVICTFLTALLLAIGKRRHEMLVSDSPADTRKTLGEYTETTLDQLLMVTLATLLVSYSLYTFFRASHLMMVTLPFAFYGVFRYHHLVHTAEVSGNPVKLFTDRPFLVNLVFWGSVTVVVLYRADTILTVLASL